MSAEQLAKLPEWMARLAQLEQSIEANPVALGRPLKGDDVLSGADRQREHRKVSREERQKMIAVLDMETDPFDSVAKSNVMPFVACLYTAESHEIIWEENHADFAYKVVAAISKLPGKYTVYAHNGGRFDFLFLVHLLRGAVKFKGRGIMAADINGHQLRDSFHIIPERLAAYHKEAFDYQKMTKAQRHQFRDEIIRYLISDCEYLLKLVTAFVAQYGFKLTIGQAAMAVLKSHYKPKRLNYGSDKWLRRFYFGGRVECLRGIGEFSGDYKLVDVNSEYPAVMSNNEHPIGDFLDYELRGGNPGSKTCFVDLTCDNAGALISRTDDGSITTGVQRGRFLTTIFEYETALKWGLIKNVDVHFSIDCAVKTNFSKFVLPLYDKRQQVKQSLADLKKLGQDTGAAWFDLKKDDIFYKLILNNAYGKFAQNPEHFKEHWLTDPHDMPNAEWFSSVYQLAPEDQPICMSPIFKSDRYAIWSKPAPEFRYQNVATAASITGAARAVLMDGLQRAKGAIYCDTDSIICREFDGDVHPTRLGAWDLEDEYDRVLICGKKLYAVWHKKPKRLTAEQIADGINPWYTIKSKGSARLTWEEMQNMLTGGNVVKVNRAPTINKFGAQYYIERTLRATGTRKD